MNSRLRWMTSLALLTLCASFANAQQTASSNKMATVQAKTDPTAPAIEEAALNLLKKSQQAMFALDTYSAECRTIQTRDEPNAKYPNGKYQLAFLTAQKPNKVRYDCWTLESSLPSSGWTKPTTTPTYIFACDGKVHYRQYGKMYRRDDRITPEYIHTILEPWKGFYTARESAYGQAIEYRKQNELREVRVTGQENVEGVLCDKVRVHVVSAYNGQKYENTATWFIGPDGLVRHYIDHVSFDDQPGNNYDATLTNIHVNEPVDAAIYAYTPPQGVTLEKEEPSAPLLANGTLAPDFTATDRNNKPVKLSDLRGKVVVVDFWASWCGPCNAAMPHNQAVMKKLRAEGLPVVMLAVNDGEKREAFETWVTQKQATLSELRFVYSSQKEDVSGKRYKVTGIPTQYVLDRQGVIRASFVGFDDATDALEKAVRAAYNVDGSAKAAAGTNKK